MSGQENIVDDAEGRCGWQNINLMQLALYRVSENVSFPVADITGAYPNSALREPRIIRRSRQEYSVVSSMLVYSAERDQERSRN